MDLFDPPPPAQRHSETSVNAANEIKPGAGTLRMAVLDFIGKCGDNGATDDEVQVALGMNPSTQRPRRVELWDMGLVRDSGRTRLTRSRRKATVWIVNEQPGQVLPAGGGQPQAHGGARLPLHDQDRPGTVE